VSRWRERESIMDQNRTVELEAFECNLDIYGADEARWPAEARWRFRTLPERDARARELLAEARALERLLDQAPMVSAARMGTLRARIVDAAARETVLRRPAFSRGRLLARSQPALDHARRLLRRSHEQAAALSSLVQPRAGVRVAAVLAASLVLGVFIGRAQPVSMAIQALADRTMADADRSVVALFDEAGSLDGEDEL